MPSYMSHLPAAVLCSHVASADRPQQAVTRRNRDAYVQAAVQHLLVTRVAGEVAAFRQGLVDALTVGGCLGRAGLGTEGIQYCS